MVPYGFTVTSHIIVTFALAALVIGTVLVYGFAKHGTHFLGLFVPSGVPAWLLPLARRDRDHLLRLAADQPLGPPLRQHARRPHRAEDLRGLRRHAAGAPASGAILAPLPLALTVALTALEFLVAVLQAYVFATLT